jgi:hypothetical protein
VAFAYALDSLATAAGHAGVGLAPLHALTIGYFAATTAMVSRVSSATRGGPSRPTR